MTSLQFSGDGSVSYVQPGSFTGTRKVKVEGSVTSVTAGNDFFFVGTDHACVYKVSDVGVVTS